MNDKRATYYPVLFYVAVLIVLWLVSWLMSVLQLLSGTGATIASLVSGEGVRWALLNVRASLETVPWGQAILMLFVIGLLAGSGVLQFFAKLCTPKRISNNELRSFILSLAVLLLYSIIVFMFTISPWQALLGVTGELSESPLAQGWPLVLLVGVIVMSLVYGFLYGNYRTLADVVVSAGNFVKKFMPALLAMLPAAGILPCIQYSGLDAVYGLSEAGCEILGVILYMLPFVYIFSLKLFGK